MGAQPCAAPTAPAPHPPATAALCLSREGLCSMCIRQQACCRTWWASMSMRLATRGPPRFCGLPERGGGGCAALGRARGGWRCGSAFFSSSIRTTVTLLLKGRAAMLGRYGQRQLVEGAGVGSRGGRLGRGAVYLSQWTGLGGWLWKCAEAGVSQCDAWASGRFFCQRGSSFYCPCRLCGASHPAPVTLQLRQERQGAS
jgi:hypothetical protein